MDLQKAQEILASVGSDNAPTAAELTTARAAFVQAAKAAKEAGDREALATMLEAIKVSDQAITEAKELEAKAAQELDALVQDIPELAGETDDHSQEDEAPAEEEAPRMLSVAEAAQRLGLAGTVSSSSTEDEAPKTVQTLTINDREANDADWSDLGNAFARYSKSMQRSGRTTLATFRTDYAEKLSGKQGENTRVLDQLSRQAADEAVVAAGGCCSLAEPIRDQPMLASLDRPIANSLPTVGSPSGKVSFFAPICLPQDGVGHWTCDDDAAVEADDPDTWKTCAEVECEEAQEVTLDAIYQCLTIGNFQQRFAPEQWDAVLHATAAAQARLAEQTLFNQIAQSDYTVESTVADTGSVYATVVQALLRAAATIKQAQRFDGRRIKAIMPAWVRDAAEMDLLARAIRRGRSVEQDNLEVVLARGGVDVIWSSDISPIQTGAAADGPLTEFPDTFQAVLYVDGGVFRLDGGELNLGTEIRDHDLNRQNKVASFAESFEAAVVRSCDTRALTIPVTVCDAAPCLEEVVEAGE